MSSLYFLYLLRHIQQELIDQATGTTFQAISGKVLREQKVPLAPLPEQERIVAEIEKQFTRLDTAVATLHRLQANLDRYKASVLKAACEGRLVPQDPHDEPAADLLRRILAERRAQWQAAHPGKKYEEVEGVGETAVLPELPEGWVWATIDQLGDVLGGLTKNAKRGSLPLQIPYLRVANVYANELNLENVETIGIREAELRRVLLEENDLLVVEGNGSVDQIGRVALWNGSISPCVHQNHIIKVRFFEKRISDFVLYWLLSPGGRKGIQRVASSTSGLYTLSLSKVSALPVPFPPLAEQHRIVAEVERRLSVVAATQQAITANLARANRLRQSILHRAFSGQLV